MAKFSDNLKGTRFAGVTRIDDTKHIVRDKTEPLSHKLRPDAPEYPQYLHKNMLDREQPALIVQGNTNLFNTNTLAIIGSGDTTEKGIKMVESCAKQAQSQNITIVTRSPEAGTSHAAYKTALENGGNAIIVLGPEDDPKKAKEIVKNHDWNRTLIVSPSDPKSSTAQNQDKSNKVLTGLSQSMVVSEINPYDYSAIQIGHQALNHPGYNDTMKTDTPLFMFNYKELPYNASGNNSLNDPHRTHKLGLDPQTKEPNMARVFAKIAKQPQIEPPKIQTQEKTSQPTPPILAIDKNSPDYPKQLAEKLGDKAPQTLFVQGNTDLLKNKTMGFANDANMSRKGMALVRHCVTDAHQKNYTIVAGDNRGGDLLAHRTALYNHGNTIMVVPEGLNNVKMNPDLAKELDWNKTLLISPFSPDTPTQKFPCNEQRQTIAAMSQAVVVIQAGESRGALTTGQEAIKTNTPVFVLAFDKPGITAIHNETLHNQGAHKLGYNRKLNGPNMPKVMEAAENPAQITMQSGQRDLQITTETPQHQASNQQETAKTPQPQMER